MSVVISDFRSNFGHVETYQPQKPDTSKMAALMSTTKIKNEASFDEFFLGLKLWDQISENIHGQFEVRKKTQKNH